MNVTLSMQSPNYTLTPDHYHSLEEKFVGMINHTHTNGSGLVDIDPEKASIAFRSWAVSLRETPPPPAEPPSGCHFATRQLGLCPCLHNESRDRGITLHPIEPPSVSLVLVHQIFVIGILRSPPSVSLV